MINLLTSIAGFELPEWLTLSSLGTGIVSVVGVICALLKLDTAKKTNNTNSIANLAALNTISDKLTVASNFAAKLENLTMQFTAGISEVSAMVKAQEDNNAKLVSFIVTAFSLSNLSAENKQKLMLEADKLFCNNSGDLIAKLESEKQKLLDEVSQYKTELDNASKQVLELKETIESNANDVKKRRSIQ